MDDAGPGDGGTDAGRDAGTDAGDMCDGVDCSGMDDECNMGVCNPATGDCEQDPLPSGTGCDDMDMCTSDDECDGSGTCVGTDVDCSGMTDMCNTGTCNPATGACGRTPMADGTTCNDGMMCTGMDRCMGGACTGTAVDCSGMTDMCNTGTCNPATGACGRTPVMDGTACTDAMACSTGDRCVGGACTPTGSVDCTAMSDMCNVGMCNPADGSCGRTPRADGTACDDMDACTMPDTCTAGSCAGTRVPTPGDQCPMAIDIPATDGVQMVTGTIGTCFRNDGASVGGRGCGAGVGAGRDAVYRLVLTETRVVRLETFAVGGSMLDDTVIHIRTACGDSATEVICDDDGSAGFFSLVNTTLNPGTYFIYLDTFSDTELGAYRMDVTLSEPEACTSAGTIALPAMAGGTVTVVGNTAGNVNDFTITGGACGGGGGPDHVYSITVPPGSPVSYTFETLEPPTSYDTTLHIRSSPCATGAAVPIACDDDGGPGALSLMTTTLAPGTYFLVVDGFGGGAGVYTLRITRNTLTPVMFPTMTSERCNLGGTSCAPLGAGGGGVLFQVGDYVGETLTFAGITQMRQLRTQFSMQDFTTGCAVGMAQNFQVLVNGTPVGTYSFTTPATAPPRTQMFDQTYSFPSIMGTGPTMDQYTIRLRTTSAVCPGGSSYNYFPGGTATGGGT